jgi:large repetitive protein
MWKNPILPGYNADPQIAMFGGKFYIYPTTDGFANWLGTNFHAWSSPDLVKWTDEGVVLDLGPGVSWADDKAWAPGIAFKGDTYITSTSARARRSAWRPANHQWARSRTRSGTSS